MGDISLNTTEITDIKNFIIEKLDPVFVIVFGSAAKDTMHKESDIDIAFYSNRVVNKYQLFIFAQELAKFLKYEVDLVDLSKASTVLQVQIVTSGKVIYSRDERKRKEFEIVVLKKYTRLNEERNIILEKIKESKSIYG